MKKVLVVAAILAMGAFPAFAQTPPAPTPPVQFAAPDAELWNEMKSALAAISMPLNAHQAVFNVINQVEKAAKEKADKKGK